MTYSLSRMSFQMKFGGGGIKPGGRAKPIESYMNHAQGQQHGRISQKVQEWHSSPGRHQQVFPGLKAHSRERKSCPVLETS